MRTVLVTGAASGIGRAIAMRLAEKGYGILAADILDKGVEELLSRLPGAGHRGKTGDLRNPSFRDILAEKFGSAHALVNCAAWQNHGAILNGRAADDLKSFETNVLAIIDLCRQFGQRMSERRGGHIVNISSALARTVYPHTAVYAATKHALSGFTKGLRLELAPFGVRVSEVRPGLVGGTNILNSIKDPDVLGTFKTRAYNPIEPRDVASVVDFVLGLPDNVEVQLIEILPIGQVS